MTQPEKTPQRSRAAGLACMALVFFWPLIFYHRYIVESKGYSLELLNDFRMLYYSYKVYLLDMLSRGDFPWWSPSEAAGFPFFSNPFAQAFYPLNLPLLAFYKTMGGYSALDHQVYTVLGISIFALGSYLWLSRLISTRPAVVFAVLAVSVSFKLGEILRLTNAVHEAAWIPWLLYGVTLAAEGGRTFKAALIVAGSCLLILTAGYPYYIYYCLFLVPPYIVLLIFQNTRQALAPGLTPNGTRPTKYLAILGGASACSLLLACPYLRKLTQLMSSTVDRAGGDYEYATAHSLSWLDTLGSLLYPPASQVEGWFYFGVCGLLLLFLHAAARAMSPGGSAPERRFWLIVIVWMLLITLITHGRNSIVFDIFWRVFPGFDHFRVWGRMNIIMLPIIALALARAFDWFSGFLEQPNQPRGKLLGIVLGGSAAVLAIQYYLLSNQVSDPYWLNYFKYHHGKEPWFMLGAAAGGLALAGLILLAGRFGRLKSAAPWIAAILLAIISAGDIFPVGHRQWAGPAHGDLGARPAMDIPKSLALSLTTRRSNSYETIRHNPHFNVGYLKNWNFQRFVDFHRLVYQGPPFKKPSAPDQEEAFKEIMGIKGGRRFFFTTTLDSAKPTEFIAQARETQQKLAPSYEVERYDGDRLRLKVHAPLPLFLSFIDNWDPDWRAWVNGRPEEIQQLFGTFKSVPIPAGESTVEMAYLPFGAW